MTQTLPQMAGRWRSTAAGKSREAFVPQDRELLRATFDAAAQEYHQARPAIPGELYDALTDQAGLRPGDRLLEIGGATGRATDPAVKYQRAWAPAGTWPSGAPCM
jgi:cyclopropane fatty-acyl-phospholipid synthase-like methyltransferase